MTAEEDDKMKMTQKLANELMDCLCALAISANGRIPETQEEIAMCQEYAQGTFLSLCEEGEETIGETWEVVPMKPQLLN